MQATFDHASLLLHCQNIREQAQVMRKMSSNKYESLLFWKKWSTWAMLSSSVLFFTLSLIGFTDLKAAFPNTSITEGLFSFILALSSLVLILASIWQIVYNADQEIYRHYNCVQRFSSLINRCKKIEKSVSCNNKDATILADRISEEYDGISNDFPFASEAEHKKAKAMVTHG